MSDALPRNAVIRGLDKAIDCFIIFNILAIAVLVCVQVLLRFCRMPLLGIEELCYFPTAWLYLGAAVKASSEKSQLVARVLEIFVRRQKTIWLLRAAAALLSCAILCWLTYWGYDLLKYSLRVDKLTDTLFIRWAYIECSLFVALALMLFYSALEARDCFRAYRTIDEAAPKTAEEVQV